MLYKVTTKIIFFMNYKSLGFILSSIFLHASSNTRSLWSKLQKNMLKTFSTSPSSAQITLSVLKRIFANGLSPQHLHAPSASSLKLFNTLFLVANPILMTEGITGVITQFFCILLNLCHQLSMPHYIMIFPLFHLRL